MSNQNNGPYQPGPMSNNPSPGGAPYGGPSGGYGTPPPPPPGGPGAPGGYGTPSAPPGGYGTPPPPPGGPGGYGTPPPPPGGPGAPGGYGTPPPPPGGYQPSGPKKSGGAGKIILIVLAVLVAIALIGGLLWKFVFNKEDKPDPKPSPTSTATIEDEPTTTQPEPTETSDSSGGLVDSVSGWGDDLNTNDCMVYVPDADDPSSVDYKVVDCDSEGFKLQVVEIWEGDMTCLRDNSGYYFYDAGVTAYTICSAPVFDVGHCYASDEGLEFVDTPCDSPDAEWKVSDKLEGLDYSSCPIPDPDAVFVIEKPEPGHVYCLDEADS